MSEQQYASDEYYDEQDRARLVVDEDVESVSARMAAATVRVDYGFIDEILMSAKRRWIEEGRDLQKDAAKRQADYDMTWHRKRRYWFRTLDGLIGEHEIDAQMDPNEMIVLAARHPVEFISDASKMDANHSIPVRRYRWNGERHRDGRPIFEEQA